MKKILFVLGCFLFSILSFSQNYHLSTNNNASLSISGCLSISPAARGAGEGFITISDINENEITSLNGIYNYSVRPYEYKVTKATCRYIEGTNRGDTKVLSGGYGIYIDPTLNSYYEKVTNGALYFEVINFNQNLELNCNTVSLDATNNIQDDDVIQWEYRFNGINGILINSQNKASLPINFENFDIDLNSNNNSLIDFRYHLKGDVYSPWKTYTIVACSPELQNTEWTDETCFNKKDGSVTLTFDGNVATGYEMRYFIYQGIPPTDPETTDLESNDPPFPNQAFADPLDIPLVAVGGGNYSGTYQGLEEGTYYIIYQEVKYKNGTATVKSGEITPQFTIDSPSQVITTGTFTAASCGNPAEIAFAASGGGTPSGDTPSGYAYQYSINNNTNWLDASNPLLITPTVNQQTVYVKALVAGSDPKCAGTELSYVIAPSTPALSIPTNPTFVPPTTDTSTDGSIRIEIENGSPGFTYILNKLNSATNTFVPVQNVTSSLTTVDFLAIDVGTYSITVTDADGCPQTSENIVVNKETIPLITNNPITEITCFNSANGSVSANISGFNTNYKYQWISNGIASAILTESAPIQSLSNLNTGGTYTLRVASGRLSDAAFSVATNYNEVSFTLATPALVTINNALPNNTNCNGSTDGSIVLDVSGGTTYEYALGNTPTDWLPLSSNTINNLSAGSYIVTIRNENGCESQPSSSIFIDEPNLLEVTEVANSRQDATTNGGNDGAIFIAITGGVAPYTFDWTGPNGYASTAQNLNTLSTGDYYLTLTDANLCTQNLGPIFINEPGPLAITSLDPTHVLCKGEDSGSITALVTGLPPFNYEWSKDGDPSFTAPNQATINGLSIGIYNLVLSDATGDPSVTQSVTITEPAEILSATVTTKAVSCFNGADGEITIITTGGTAPYQYNFDTGLGFQNSSTLGNLAMGTFPNIIVQDANGCTYTLAAIFVNQATEINIATDQVLNISEAGETDGAIYTTTTGGNLPYAYAWSGPDGYSANTKDITGLNLGLYTLTVTDANNCSEDKLFNITEPGELIVDVQLTIFLNCNAETTGEITADVQGGVLNYTYEWHQIINGNDITLSETSPILGDLPAGSFYLIVTDANAISRTSSTVIITEPEELVATLNTKIDVLCSGEATGSIDVAIIGGTAPYTFYWNNTLSTQNLDALPAGDYYFDVIDANGCSDQLEITIEAPLNPLTISTETVVDASQYQGTDGSISIELSGGAPAYTIAWTKVSDNTFISAENSINNLTAGDYQVLVTDTNGCSLTEVFTVKQPDIIEETIVAPICAGGTDGSISLIVNKGNGAFTFSWNTGATTANIDNLSAGEYTVLITGFDAPISRTYVVEDPLPIQVNLGDDRVLCDGQVLTLDASVENLDATYLWTADNGFSSTEAIVTLSERGNYTLNISTATGCTVTGTITIDVSDEEISAELAASSQVFVGESLILVDISYPLPESMEWIIPDNATVITSTSDEAEITFDTPGEYEVGIITQRGPCTEIQTKKVLVLNNDPTVGAVDTENGQKLVEDFILYPNPTSGVFNAQITMSEVGAISIKVFSFANNNQIAIVKEKGKATYDIPFDISIMPAGVYAVLLETPYGTSLRKIIIK
ncbi:T9SS type A sorting domain-containing protein [Cellulophaga sp. HaHa_2_95]|uniref:T9SS type A sorting domain-containing protein n=1 Tax=Cellulophaga sp. HaHa_2_95 TaxID=2745558 RepID=UPI001C4FF1DC|nr:T9SS type A sorting domain-containing protein [Cellulophaga sp. HaHa_2_95]QXP56908.1 T9SS type A sorting domain-containing protein [Cellulophaga sp. HaHa_2_95]